MIFTVFICNALILVAMAVWVRRSFGAMETDLDGLYETVAMLTRTIHDQQNEIEAFKERFEEVMNEAEKQVQLEAQWNTGLNNILNYCLEDSFKAGGGN